MSGNDLVKASFLTYLLTFITGETQILYNKEPSYYSVIAKH